MGSCSSVEASAGSAPIPVINVPSSGSTIKASDTDTKLPNDSPVVNDTPAPDPVKQMEILPPARDALLENVSQLDTKGANPSRLIVYGERAEAILTGERPQDVIIAAGYLGNGRVVVASNDRLMDGFKEGNNSSGDMVELHKNIKKWVSDGKYSDGDNVCDLTEMWPEELKDAVAKDNSSILLWRGTTYDNMHMEDSDNEQISDTVYKKIAEDGCGCVISPYIYRIFTLNHPKSLEQVALYNVLSAVGVRFSRDFYGKAPILTSNNKANKSHLVGALKRMATDEDFGSEDSQCFMDYLFAIPEKERAERIAPVLKECRVKLPGYDEELRKTPKKFDCIDASMSPVDAILNNVSVLELNGEEPGCMVVYGEGSVPVLTGTKPHRVMIAAAQLGKGRVIVAAHDAILSGFEDEENDNREMKQMQDNMKVWVSNGAHSGQTGDICHLSAVKAADLGGASIFTWSGGELDAETAEALQKKITDEGRGLVIAVTPWPWHKWDDETGQSDINEMPVNNILLAIGICFVADRYEVKPIRCCDNRAERGHARHANERLFEMKSKMAHNFDDLDFQNLHHLMTGEAMDAVFEPFGDFEGATLGSAINIH